MTQLVPSLPPFVFMLSLFERTERKLDIPSALLPKGTALQLANQYTYPIPRLA